MPNWERSFSSTSILIVLIALGALLHWNVWNNDISGIHAWRQTQTMTVVENFAFENMNILNPRINSRGNQWYLQNGIFADAMGFCMVL